MDRSDAVNGIHANIVRLIGRRIIGGALNPGEILPEQIELSRQLGVSRTVVREATKVLTAKGLVESRPKRGTVVLPRANWRLLDPDVLAWQTELGGNDEFVKNVFEVREIIEPAAAKLAAERATPEEAEAIKRAYAAMEQASDQGDYLQADIRYHELMVSATHNDHLIQLTAAFTSALQAGLRATIRNDREWSTFMNFSLPLHRAVLDAVLARKGEVARKAMVELVERSRRGTVEDMTGNGTRKRRART